MEKIGINEKFHVSHLEHLRSLNGIPLSGFRSRGIVFIRDLSVFSGATRNRIK